MSGKQDRATGKRPGWLHLHGRRGFAGLFGRAPHASITDWLYPTLAFIVFLLVVLRIEAFFQPQLALFIIAMVLVAETTLSSGR